MFRLELEYDLIIENVKIVYGDYLVTGDIGVKDGRIVMVGLSSVRAQGDMRIDGGGLIALPGLIDSHVHFRDPGLTHKEDFWSGSMAAAAGGVTTVFDMPNTVPPVTDVLRFKDKVGVVSAKSFVDFGLYGGASESNTGEINDLSKAGVIGFKTYMAGPPNGSPEYNGIVSSGGVGLLKTMEATSKTGVVHVVHAEDGEIVSYLSEKLKAEGRLDPAAHCDSRPNMVEALAVERAIAFAERTGTKLHIAHISTKEALEAVRRAKARGVRVTCETCPQYLLLTRKDVERFGAYAKFNPPPRSQEDLSTLVAGLKDGGVDILVTDHAPHTKDEKEAGRFSIWDAPSGTPGVETRLPLVLTMAQVWGLGYSDIARLCSHNVAKIFGLGLRKGLLHVGFDADIVLINPYEEWSLKASELHTKAWETFLFDGMKVRGRVVYTIVRGRIVYQYGVGFTDKPSGRFIPGPMYMGG
ncbi:MAG: allantoinase AllB [Thermoprotei archaeon]